MSRGAERANAWLTAALLLGIVVAGNQLARRHLVVRRDLSEDQLYAVSDATRRILARLEDRLQVTTYFTGRIESGEVALAKAGIEARLDELREIAGPRMEVVALDPSSSSQAEADAVRLGILPIRVAVQQGTQPVQQSVFLGLALRYRGREQVLERADLRGFEVQFASAVYALVRDRRAVVGWLGEHAPADDPLGPTFASFQTARNMISVRHELVDVEHLDLGEPVPRQVEILFVVRPRELHPRAAFEIDQFVQRGGRLVVLVDQVSYSWYTREAREDVDPPPPTGLEELLRAYGALPTPAHVWDVEGASTHAYLIPLGRDPLTGEVRHRAETCTTPIVVEVAAAGLDPEHPVTSGLQEVRFSWAQPVARGDVPAGVERTAIVSSSPDSYLTPITGRHVVSRADIEAKTVIERGDRRRPPMSFLLAAALSGRFPSPFDAAPAPFDPLRAQDSPAGGTTDEPVLSAAADTHVVVFGDADWMRDGEANELFPFVNRPEHRHLLMNLVDWLTLDDDLIALRRRVPRDRELLDFDAEARADLGLSHATLADTQEEFEERLRLEERARDRARAERWRRMLLPVLSTLGVVLGFGLAWNLSQRGGRGA